MFGYENGKKIASLGFLLATALIVVQLGASFFLVRALGFNPELLSVLSLLSSVSYLLVAGGYFLMWMSRKEFLDFVTAGLAAATVVVPIFMLWILKFPAVFYSMLMALIWAALYFSVALRAKNRNSTLALLLCGVAFFQVLSMFLPVVTGGVPADGSLRLYAMNFVSLISLAVKLGGAGLCFLATKMN
ncbi:MAG: hypothetical protein E7580_07745 [Ruminococcaceae bacterium]|nr:hypothetical protein [Oscillospiraceae bacterium]